MPPRKKARVTVTREDGQETVYHTNRRDALHQLLLGAGALSTDRCACPCHRALGTRSFRVHAAYLPCTWGQAASSH